MDELVQKIINHPENKGLLPYSQEDIEVDLRGIDKWELGVHPDLVDKFWDIGKRNASGADPRAVIGGPALVHPISGIVYAITDGGDSHALRLPPKECAEARKQSGETEDTESEMSAAKKYGDKWAYVETWHNPKADEWHRAAFAYAKA